jgi:hypothetical protein
MISLRIRRKKDIVKLFDIFYENADLFLTRKKEKLQNFIQDIHD